MHDKTETECASFDMQISNEDLFWQCHLNYQRLHNFFCLLICLFVTVHTDKTS